MNQIAARLVIYEGAGVCSPDLAREGVVGFEIAEPLRDSAFVEIHLR